MSPYDDPDFDGHEFLGFFTDEASGLRAVIAIHRKISGFGGGGIRMYPYARVEDAVHDVLRLSKAMTYKLALAGIPFGGGKAVIIGDPKKDKSEALLEAFGRAVQGLGGQYLGAEDVGTTPEDMTVINRTCEYIVGLPGKSGDTSPTTGYGVFRAMEAAAEHAFGKADLSGVTVAVQGCGNVGRHLMHHLKEAGAHLIVADVDREAVDRAVESFGAVAVAPDEILSADCDILAPCALGAVLDDETIPAIKAKIVCGGANNQLAEARHALALDERGILFVPDYLANAGGAVNASGEFLNRDEAETRAMLDAIGGTAKRVLERARQEGITPLAAADEIAEEIIAAAE